MEYIVLSENFAGGPAGTVIAESELDSCNIPALIEAGHIAAQPNEAGTAENDKEQTWP